MQPQWIRTIKTNEVLETVCQSTTVPWLLTSLIWQVSPTNQTQKSNWIILHSVPSSLGEDEALSTGCPVNKILKQAGQTEICDMCSASFERHQPKALRSHHITFSDILVPNDPAFVHAQVIPGAQRPQHNFDDKSKNEFLRLQKVTVNLMSFTRCIKQGHSFRVRANN